MLRGLKGWCCIIRDMWDLYEGGRECKVYRTWFDGKDKIKDKTDRQEKKGNKILGSCENAVGRQNEESQTGTDM